MDRYALLLLVMLSAHAAAAAGGDGPPAPRAGAAAATTTTATPAPYAVVLGITQDAGYPQAACDQPCCAAAWSDPERRRRVSCLAIVDPAAGQRWLIDATPDFREQLHRLDAMAPLTAPPGGIAAAPGTLAATPAPVTRAAPGLAGIFLTHAHIGHYTGLVHLGREAVGARGVPVHVMPRMHDFLSGSGPWDQLVTLENIELRRLTADRTMYVNERIAITPFLVPHRDEYSETVGYRVHGPEASVLFIPDIDKWERWSTRIEDLIAAVDVAYLDGTFFGAGELPGRDMAAIPHPSITESMARFSALPARERGKVRFIHLNHTNEALRPGSNAAREIERAGFHVAAEGERVGL